MTVIVVMVIASLLVAGGFLVAFIWAVRSGQYDDTYTPSVRMLFDGPRGANDKVQDARENHTSE